MRMLNNVDECLLEPNALVIIINMIHHLEKEKFVSWSMMKQSQKQSFRYTIHDVSKSIWQFSSTKNSWYKIKWINNDVKRILRTICIPSIAGGLLVHGPSKLCAYTWKCNFAHCFDFLRHRNADKRNNSQKFIELLHMISKTNIAAHGKRIPHPIN